MIVDFKGLEELSTVVGSSPLSGLVSGLILSSVILLPISFRPSS